MYILQNAHWFVILIGALIFFHELGHFLVAKACDVKVLRFALGFGPKLFSYKKGETEYQLRALPLGGYVKMLGEIPGEDEDIAPEDEGRSFDAKPIWQRAAIAFAGPAFNLLLAFIVYFFMFSGTHQFGATKLGIVSKGQPAWQAGLRPGDTIRAINGEETEHWEQLRQVIATSPGKDLQIDYERHGKAYTGTLRPEAHSQENVFKEQETKGRIGISLQYLKPIVAVIDETSPAALAGIQTGDQILSINKSTISAWHEVRQLFAGLSEKSNMRLILKRGEQEITKELVSVDFPQDLKNDVFSSADSLFYTGLINMDTIINEVEEGSPAAKAGLLKNDRLLSIAIENEDGISPATPIGVWAIDLSAFQGSDARARFHLSYQRGIEIKETQVQLEAREETDDFKNKRTVYRFGAHNNNTVLDTYLLERQVSLGEAFYEANLQVLEDMSMIIKGIAKIVQGVIPLDTMGGPIMLFVIAEKSAKRGWDFFFRMFAMISVNLGILNLFPLPVLDGGQLMFLAYEAIRRRPPPMRFRELANVFGFGMLLLLMVLVFHNDIIRYVLG